MNRKLKRQFRYFYLRFIRLKATPEQIARGFAIGIFWGMFPLPGIQMLTAIVTAAVLRGSKVAAIAGTWVGNPLTTVPLTALNFHVGQSLLGRSWSDLPIENLQSINGFFQLGGEVIAIYLLGCLITGTLGGLASYFLGIPLVDFIQKRAFKDRKRNRRRNNSRA
ncbi:MAG: DUF2062 domain-containing protein [Oculatellaceae cyanobacterium Prado106]|jgi:hypothetical protein|nr:DUF2062 domain-containing protein [Oculatellaceae cyanobacterium Prado106]